jgi:hypothetical protein
MTFTLVEINPNLRITDGNTVVDRTAELASMHVGDLVAVFESQSGIYGRAWIASFDDEDDSVILYVDWANLKVPTNSSIPVVSPTPHRMNLHSIPGVGAAA